MHRAEVFDIVGIPVDRYWPPLKRKQIQIQSKMARSNVKLGRVAFIVILFVVFGYLIIFFSVLFGDDKPKSNDAEDAKYLAILKKKQKYNKIFI